MSSSDRTGEFYRREFPTITQIVEVEMPASQRAAKRRRRRAVMAAQRRELRAFVVSARVKPWARPARLSERQRRLVARVEGSAS